MCTQSQKSNFLWYLSCEIIKQAKEASFIFISFLFLLLSVWFCPFALEPNGTVPNRANPSVEPKEHGQRLQMERFQRF